VTYSPPDRRPDKHRDRDQASSRGSSSPWPYLLGLLGALMAGIPALLLVVAFAKGGDALWIFMGAPLLGVLLLIGLLLIVLAFGLARR